ncbi:unnamed protein product, partial [Meganyctiphanes norvegica]
MVISALATVLLAVAVTYVQGADSDVERVRNPFVSKVDLGPLMSNQNVGNSIGRSITPGFQRDSTFASNPSGCLSCTHGNGGSRTFGVDHFNAPKTTSTRREYRKEQKFVNGQPVYDFHHEKQYQDGQLVHEDRHETGEDDVGVSAPIAGFHDQRGLGRNSFQRNSQASSFNNYQSGSLDMNRHGSNGYITPQTSSTRREFRKEQKFVNGQPVYAQQHERQFEDGRLIHEERKELDENDFGVSPGIASNIGQESYLSSSKQSSSAVQSTDIGSAEVTGADFHADTSRLRQKLQEQMRTFRTKPRISTVGTSERSESRSESRYVNGQPVYARNEEQRYRDGDLVHSNVEEKGAADFGNSHLINSAAHGRYATRGSGSHQENQRQYQQSVSGSQLYPTSGSQERTNSAREQSQEQSSTSYRPSYTPRRTPISTQQSSQQSSTSYRPSYTPSRSTVYSEETQRQESSSNSGYRPRVISTNIREENQQEETSSSASSYPGYRPAGSSAYGQHNVPNRPNRNDYESQSSSESRDSTLSSHSNSRPHNRRTDSSFQSNYEETSQNSQVGQTYGSSSGSSYRPRGSSTTYREESQNQESATYPASRPSSSNLDTSVTVEGEDISLSSSYQAPGVSPSRSANGDKPAIYDHSYFARNEAERRRAGARYGSRDVYNGPRQVDLDLSETNGLNEHLIGTGRYNTQESYDGSSQYGTGSSYDRSHGSSSYGSSSYDSSYGSSSSASESDTNFDVSTVSNVNDNNIETEYDDTYDGTDDDYESHDEEYVYGNTNSGSSYYEDENNNRLNKERYDISPYDGIEGIPRVDNEVETSYNSHDSHSQPEPVDYHNYDEEEQVTGSPTYAYDNQDVSSRPQGYPQTSEAPSSSHYNYPSYNQEVVPSEDRYQSSYNYSNNEVQQSSYPAVPYEGHDSSNTYYQESQEQSSISSGAQLVPVVPASSSSHSSSRTNEERRENIYDSGAYGQGISITSPHTKTRRTELRTNKKYVNGQLVGLTFYERVYENGILVSENKTERGRDELTQEELQQYGISMAEFDQPIYNQGGSYSQKQEVTQKRKFVNGQQIYDLHHERQYEDGSLVHENRTEKDEDEFGAIRHGSSGYAVGSITDTNQVAQSQHRNQQALAGTVAHSYEDRQVTDDHIVNAVPHYTSRREEVRTQQKFVNGQPVYDLQHEKKYVDGKLIHENKTELTEDELRIRFGHRDALQDILTGQTLSTARDRNYGSYGNYGSTTSEQSQSGSTQSRSFITGGSSDQSVSGGASDLGYGGHQSQPSYSGSSAYDSSSTYGSSGYGTGSGSQTSNGGAHTTVLDLGSAGSDSSAYGRGSQTAGGAVLSVGSGVQGGQSSYSGTSSYENESRSTSVGGGSNFDSSNLAGSSYDSNSYEASQMGTSLLSGHSSAGSGGARTVTLDLGSSSSLGLGDQLLGSGGHQSQSSTYESGSSYGSSNLAGSGRAHDAQQSSYGSSSSFENSQMGTSLLSGYSSAGSGGARTVTLGLGSSSQGHGDHLVGSGGHQSQSSTYESGSSYGSSNLAGSGRAHDDQQSSYGSSSSFETSQMGTSLLDGHSSAGSGGARTVTLDLGSSSLGHRDHLVGSGGHQSQSSTYESGSSYGSSSSSSGSSGCISCVVSSGGGFGASASGLPGANSHSQGHQMSKEEHYENGDLVHGQESERDFENGQLVREQSRQYGGRNAQQPSSAARTSRVSSSSSYGSSSQSSYGDASGVGVKTRVRGSNTGTCANNPCENGGTCIAGLRGALCVCTFGFKGKTCGEPYCPTRFCRYKGVCSIEDGGHICSCREGHTGARCATRTRRHASKHRRRHASNP